MAIRNLAIIERLEVDLGAGLNVVTGETGAGKSIVVDALSLVLGARSSAEVVRTGEDAAEVEAVFDAYGDDTLLAALDAAGVREGDEVLLRRVVSSSGRSRAWINGRLATLAQLAELAPRLVDISSQHEHQSLADPAVHLELLDEFAALDADRAEMQAAYDAMLDATRALDAVVLDDRARAEREDLLRFQLREIDEVAPRAGEEEELTAERARLAHGERLRGTASSAEERLYSGDGALCESLGAIAADLATAGRLDATLAPWADQVDAARTSLEEVGRELGGYLRKLPSDPERLGEVEDRLHQVTRIRRKYGPSIEDVLARRDASRTELEGLERHEERLETLRAAREAALKEAGDVARRLSKKRRDAARKLGDGISAELGALGMGSARVTVDVAPLDGALPSPRPSPSGGEGDSARGPRASVDGTRLSARGMDRVELLIAPNKGEEPRPLRRIASGGELSRAMLAVKTVVAGLRAAGTYVFDEVDAGVGGAVAEAIGRKIKDVSRHRQVVCITHLPQIAVWGDRHFHVSKHEAKGRTVSAIAELAGRDRTEEISRMLGGARITDKTRAAAEELLERVRAAR
ncbi:MAG: DNA repair protein RecN [Deltaproteobacteria bacterium]|nr:DNA repair protein RecN [Deltaproteobacteria bacterium]